MVSSGYSSPLLTSHDTLGSSTLETLIFMRPSPPRHLDSIQESAEEYEDSESDRVATRTAAPHRRSRSRGLSRSPSPRNERNELDARLANYTLDLSKLRSEQLGLDEKDDYTLPELKAPKEDEDKLSEVGGPPDFTENMEKYLFGDSSSPRKSENGNDDDEEHAQPQRPKRPVVEDEADLVEYSEFGPPVDMSTPSHLLRRNNATVKDGTSLEDIEEDGVNSSHTATTPSTRKQKASVEDDTYDDLRRQVEYLKDQLRDRDEQIQANRKRVLEAASATEQIKHLQAELQRKTALLNEMYAKRGDESLLREQLQLLQKQNDEKSLLLQKASEVQSKLEQRVERLEAELKNRNESAAEDKENSETIASLQQQLDTAREELKKRDDALEESAMKLNEVAAAKDLQIRQKNTEIEELKAQIEDQRLEIEKLEEDIELANSEYESLEERIVSLENRNQPLEEKNIILENDLARAQSQVATQQKALETVAVDLSIATDSKTFTEILDALKALCLSRMASAPESQRESNAQEEEINELRKELSKLQQELKETTSARETLDLELRRSREQVSELRNLITTIEGENSRLTATFEELSSNLSRVQNDLDRVKEEHAQALITIERLGKEKESVQRQLSPPPSPPNGIVSQYDYNAMQEAHQAELRSLQSAHATAISTMRDSYAQSTRKLRDLLAAAEKRESDLKSELESLRATTSAQKNQLKQLNAEIERLDSLIAVKDEAAAAVDERIARSVEKREKEWERRVDLLLRERDKMSKALLMAWGEKELPDVKDNGGDCGARGPRQGYRYKYVVRNSGKK